jgi:hypothetical protein
VKNIVWVCACCRRCEQRLLPLKRFFGMYVLSIIYLRPLNLKSTASGVSGASLACGASRESLESGASRPSEGENGRLKIDVAEKIRSLLHFRCCPPPPLCSKEDDIYRGRIGQVAPGAWKVGAAAMLLRRDPR